MACYFIDIKGFVDNFDSVIIKELCIMNVNDILHPYHYVYRGLPEWDTFSPKCQSHNEAISKYQLQLMWTEGKDFFCPSCISLSFDADATFFVLDAVDGCKLNILKEYFPTWRLINYSVKPNSLRKVPQNITCPWREHGLNCAYKRCLLGVLDYLNTE